MMKFAGARPVVGNLFGPVGKKEGAPRPAPPLHVTLRLESEALLEHVDHSGYAVTDGRD